MKRKACRCGRTKRARLARPEAHALALDFTACLGKQAQRFAVTAKIDPDFAQYPVGLRLQLGQVRFVQQLIGGNAAPKRPCPRDRSLPRCAAGTAAAAAGR